MPTGRRGCDGEGMSLPHAKGYATEGEARRSKAGQRPGAEFTPCWSSSCGLVHVTFPKTAPARVTQLAARDTGPSRAVRELVLDRDGRACVACGVSVRGIPYSLQHRRARGSGGTSDPLANSPVNLVTLCGSATTPGSCHLKCEQRDQEMNARGYWLRQWEDPATAGVMVFSEGGSGATKFAHDDGTWRDEPQAVAA